MIGHAIAEQTFLRNVAEARENGFTLVCAECGAGIYDESDLHERNCPAAAAIEAAAAFEAEARQEGTKK
jgi:hypothetical protein